MESEARSEDTKLLIFSIILFSDFNRSQCVKSSHDAILERQCIEVLEVSAEQGECLRN